MSIDLKNKIKESIQSFTGDNLADKGILLFKTLGYITDRQARLDNPVFEDFRDNFIAETTKFSEDKALVSEWNYIDILFQLSKEEVLKQTSLFDTKQVDRTIIETYLFITIGLNGNEYTRTQLAQITREVNRVFPMPVLILFKYNSYLTLSAINRRLHKRDESKDVLEKVTQIKDIRIDAPHRAHIEILFDLSFDELNRQYCFTNFVELHNAWQKTLDTKELNKRFYSELFNWYLWAVKSVCFPNDMDDNKDDMVYNSESVIRLLTRLIFVWFIKEKGLVPDVLFDEREMKKVLKNFNPVSTEKSAFYRAILQNLFFATLNTQMDKDVKPEEKRRFVKLEPKYNNPDYTDQTKYRYKDYFVNQEEAIKLFASIPFLNGGLFECLDSKESDPKTGKEREFRYDGFSTYKEKQAFVPDKLFFAPEFTYDLNSDYGTKNKSYKVEGLLNILNSYKFTITENTPLDEEIALDPELLGKVFENLLASYNPETQTTARKQTGSFYTPREIVNYMVDESLIAYLKQKLGNTTENEERLRHLFAPVEQMPAFTSEESRILVNALSTAKILDPACGSGAFPMGILHRMVDLLKKLDPENKLWFELQKQRAIDETTEVFNSGDTQEREIRLSEINKAFDLGMNFPDYARKLFLIENCIYGVDIQQIAIQISKLRFFISLIVDQKVDDNKPNRNILSMPNLETRFVAANTLIGLDKPQQLSLMADEVKQLEKELISIRHKIFFTRKYHDKKELKKQDKAKRQELEKALERSGYTKNTAAQMAGWNPFDPMKSAPFFDTEAMFGFLTGFNIVLGNPPYGIVYDTKKKETYENRFPSFKRNNDIYVAFFEGSLSLLCNSGTLVFITPNTYLNGDYFKALRKLITEKTKLNEIVDFKNSKIFQDPTVFVAITNFSNHGVFKEPYDVVLKVSNEDFTNTEHFNFTISEITELPFKPTNPLISKITSNKSLSFYPLDDLYFVKDVGFNYWSIGKGKKRDGDSIGDRILYSGIQKNKKDKSFLKGKDIDKYYISEPQNYLRHNFSDYLVAGVDIFRYSAEFLEVSPKIIYRQTSNKIIAAVDFGKNLCDKTVHVVVPKNHQENIIFLVALLNSQLFNFFYKDISQELEGRTFAQVKTVYIKQLPLVKFNPDTKLIIEKIVLMTILAKKSMIPNSDFFERLLDSIVYELYLPEQIKTAGCEVLKHLNNLPQLKEGNNEATEQENLKIIEKVQKELSDPKHPVSIAIFKMDTIEEIRIIEGKQ